MGANFYNVMFDKDVFKQLQSGYLIPSPSTSTSTSMCYDTLSDLTIMCWVTKKEKKD